MAFGSKRASQGLIDPRVSTAREIAASLADSGRGMAGLRAPAQKNSRLPKPPRKSFVRKSCQNHSGVAQARKFGVGCSNATGFFRNFISYRGGQSKHCVRNGISVAPSQRPARNTWENSSA